jgi:hypothetical protein
MDSSNHPIAQSPNRRLDIVGGLVSRYLATDQASPTIAGQYLGRGSRYEEGLSLVATRAVSRWGTPLRNLALDRPGFRVVPERKKCICPTHDMCGTDQGAARHGANVANGQKRIIERSERAASKAGPAAPDWR